MDRSRNREESGERHAGGPQTDCLYAPCPTSADRGPFIIYLYRKPADRQEAPCLSNNKHMRILATKLLM